MNLRWNALVMISYTWSCGSHSLKPAYVNKWLCEIDEIREGVGGERCAPYEPRTLRTESSKYSRMSPTTRSRARHAHDADVIPYLRNFAHGERAFAGVEEVLEGNVCVAAVGEL